MIDWCIQKCAENIVAMHYYTENTFYRLFVYVVGYMRVWSDSDGQSTNLQRDALQAAGIDARHLFEDRASGAKDDRPGLVNALEFVCPGDVLVEWSRLTPVPQRLKSDHTTSDLQIAPSTRTLAAYVFR